MKTENIQSFVRAVNGAVWGTPMLVLIMGCGVYLTLRLHAFQLTRAGMWMKETFGAVFDRKKEKLDGISPYRAVTSALASSIGTGNIVGVATAVTAGGAGAVFWMWVSAFLGMAVKYAEIFLAVKFREKGEHGYFGGPMYYIEKGLGGGYKWLAAAFAVSGSLACLGMGAMNQSNSIASVAKMYTHIPGWACGAVLALIAAVSLRGGIARISSITEKLVPLMAGAYILGGAAVVFISPSDAWSALCEIVTSAVSPRAVYGAAAGEAVKSALRYGISRGVFSNEAGLGSAPIVHAAANAKSPSRQGMWGIFEVFVDTVVVCTVTAIVIVGSGYHAGDASGAELVTLSFEKYFGAFGGVFIAVSTVLFALSTILGWSYYGESCVSYLCKGKIGVRKLYRTLFAAAVMLGALLRVDFVWELADMFNGIMMIPNLIAVISLSGIVIKETKKSLSDKLF